MGEKNNLNCNIKTNNTKKKIVAREESITGAELKLVEVVSDEINESTNTDYYALWVGTSRNVGRSNDFSSEGLSFQNPPLGLSTFHTQILDHVLTVRPATDIGFGNAIYVAPQLMSGLTSAAR